MLSENIFFKLAFSLQRLNYFIIVKFSLCTYLVFLIPLNIKCAFYHCMLRSLLKMKQQTHDKLNVWRTRKKPEPQMGFEPMTLRDLVGCSNH